MNWERFSIFDERRRFFQGTDTVRQPTRIGYLYTNALIKFRGYVNRPNRDFRPGARSRVLVPDENTYESKIRQLHRSQIGLRHFTWRAEIFSSTTVKTRLSGCDAYGHHGRFGQSRTSFRTGVLNQQSLDPQEVHRRLLGGPQRSCKFFLNKPKKKN